MKAEIIDIGRYIKVPYQVVLSKVSPRAFQVWSRIAADASPENPLAQVHQRTLAIELRCSPQTIGRAIAELVRNQLLTESGTWERGRCKIYRVNWTKDSKPTIQKSSPNTQLEIPLECYVRVGPKVSSNVGFNNMETKNVQAAPPKESPVPDDPNRESEQEREWIIARIKLDNALQRKKNELETKKRESYAVRGQIIKPPPIIEDKPICPENYPILWRFLRLQWADGRKRIAA